MAVTPRFGPSSWRDFHLADLFLAAGRQAAEEQLPALQSWHGRSRRRSQPRKETRWQLRHSRSTTSSGSSWTAWACEEDDVVDDPDATFEDMGLDSLAFVEIQLAMQQEYGFTIPDEDAEQITTVGQAIEYVNERLAEKE